MVGPDIKSPETFSTLKFKINVKTDMFKTLELKTKIIT